MVGQFPRHVPINGRSCSIRIEEKKYSRRTAKGSWLASFDSSRAVCVPATSAAAITSTAPPRSLRRYHSGADQKQRHQKQCSGAENKSAARATKIIADEYEKMGEENVKPLFPADHTHTSPEGARLVASLIAAGLKDAGRRSPNICVKLR